MGSLSNIDLLNLSKFYNLPLYNVMQKDNLKDCKFYDNSFYIINNQNSSQQHGKHAGKLQNRPYFVK